MPSCFKYLASGTIALALSLPGRTADLAGRVGVWPQSYTGRSADPSVHFGQLPNGLRYAIRHNSTPPGQMSLRLYIGSGSLSENDDQQGFAHFLEHMAFRGSSHLADGDVVKILARHGLSFGADTNAVTTHENTVYHFDFPTAGTDDIDTGLMLFREIGSNLTLGKESLDAERGVILSEERLRDTPAYRQIKAQIGFLLPGRLAPRRMPIGQMQIIQNATPEQLRGFYEREYRPDNAVIVAVGDFDPTVMEAKITEKFSDWKSRETSQRRPEGPVQVGKEQVGLFSEAGAPQVVQISWLRAYDDAADTNAREDRDNIRLIAILIFNHRLEAIAQRPEAPFVEAHLSRSNVLKSADVTNLAVAAPADRWQTAMKAAISEQQRVVRFGITQPELDRVQTELRSSLAAAVARASTLQTPSLANAIVKSLNDGNVVRSPQQSEAELASSSGKVDVEAVNAALRDIFSGFGPRLFVSTSQAPAGGAQAFRSAFDAALQDKVTDEAVTPAIAWPYKDFGVPGHVVERKEVSDLGLTLVRFSNGTTLTIKPTGFTRGQVLTAVGFGHGRLGLSPNLAHAYWLVNGTVPAFIQSGTGKLPFTEVQQALAAHASKLELAMQDKAFELASQTEPANLDFVLQLSTAYMIDPGFRPEVVDRYKAGLAAYLPQVDATATGVFKREQGIVLHAEDRRWTTIPILADVTATKPEDLEALLRSELREASPHIVIVGDISVDQAITSVAKTLGALPTAGSVKARFEAPVNFPAGNSPIIFGHHGRPEQAVALMAWPTPDFFANPTDARALRVASELIRQRLTDQLREMDGATYSPQVSADASQTIPGYGYLSAAVEIPSAKIPLFQQRLASIIADLRNKPASADELQRAKAPLVQSRLRDQQQNTYWYAALIGYEQLPQPRTLDAIRTRPGDMQAVTAGDVQSVVRKYADGIGYRMIVQHQDE